MKTEIEQESIALADMGIKTKRKEGTDDKHHDLTDDQTIEG